MRVLGLDIGGSTTRAVLAAGGVTVAEASGPSASLTAAGPDAASKALDDVLARLAGSAGGAIGPLAAVCAGTAGSGAVEAGDWVADSLRLSLGAHLGAGLHARDVPIAVVNDSLLVLAAEELTSGIALVAGTGSIAWGVLGDRQARAGGWGWLLGDEGSGYWIVREALRELCRRDARGEAAGGLAEVFGGAPTAALVARFHAEPAPATWAALAPGVLEAPDPAATAIGAAGASCLAELAADVAAALGNPPSVRVVLAGGLAGRPGRYADAVARAVSDLVAGAQVSVATRPAVAGAVRLARRLAEAQLRGG